MTVVFDYLVFNVQFVFAVSQQLIHYIIHFVVCQVFFLSFFKNFFYLTENLFWRFSFSNFCIISYRLTFVKNFFNFFWNFISSSCSVLTVSNFYILSQIQVLVKNFFKFFWKTFWTSFFRSSVLFLLATFTSYHRWSCLSRTFLFFLKTFLSFCRLRQRQVI